MHLKRFVFTTLFLIAGAASVSAAVSPQLIIPASATGPGVNGSQWQSEVTLHNAGAQPIPVTLRFHDLTGAGSSVQITIAPRTTSVLADVVASRFSQVGSATGAIVVEFEPAFLSKLAVTSRTFNTSTAGEFGQDIPAITLPEALVSGDTGVLTAPSNVAAYRFNFGVFAVDATTIQWRLLRSDGTLAGEVERSYAAGFHVQYNDGIRALLSKEPANSDVVHARVISGRAVIYGSAINQSSNDPSFVHYVRTRENLSVEILGIDLDEDGDIDVFDADRNGLLDAPIDIITSTFPNYFRIIASDPEGSTLTYQLVDGPRDAQFIDDQGTLQWLPGSDVRGTTGTLRVRVSDGTDATDLIIPVIFR